MILRLLNVQGIAGLAATLALTILLAVQKVETRHWREESARCERLYTQEHAAFAQTQANYRAAAEQARNDDASNRARVEAEQVKINQEQSDEYETRIAAALLLSACASQPKPQPIRVLAEQRQCPAYPLPPADLLKPPLKTNFLNPTPSPPPSRRSSSTN